MNWIIGMVIGFVVGAVSLLLFSKFLSGKNLLRAQREADRILEEAKSESESLKKEKMIEVQEELFEQKQKLTYLNVWHTEKTEEKEGKT